MQAGITHRGLFVPLAYSYNHAKQIGHHRSVRLAHIVFLESGLDGSETPSLSQICII